VANATKLYGAPGEIDDQDRSVKISVVPRPYQRPHPPLFQAFSVSPRTMEWCAEEDITPTVLPGPLSLVGELAETYAKACREHGRNYEIGEHNALVREIYICEEDEIEEYIEKYDRLIWEHWFRGFGFYEAFRLPGEEGPIPSPGESLAQRMIKSDYLIAGPIEKVKARVKEIHDRFNFEYWVLLFHQGLMPEEVANKQMDQIAEVLNDL
jgi:alkanesulfonate monooxygenase SsuD/methylene tetrahydromethanopterin reductase-like flavin-dependent oxidoreductase (luciferase family)